MEGSNTKQRKVLKARSNFNACPVYGHRVIVQNVHKNISNGDIFARFEQFGTIFSCVLQEDEFDRKKQVAIVNFETLEAANRAIKSSGGKSRAEGATHVSKYNDVFCYLPADHFTAIRLPNLPDSLNQDQLMELAEVFGLVLVCCIQKEGGLNTGFVKFAFMEAAQEAWLQLSGEKVDGHVLRVDPVRDIKDYIKPTQDETNQAKINSSNKRNHDEAKDIHVFVALRLSSKRFKNVETKWAPLTLPTRGIIPCKFFTSNKKVFKLSHKLDENVEVQALMSKETKTGRKQQERANTLFKPLCHHIPESQNELFQSEGLTLIQPTPKLRKGKKSQDCVQINVVSTTIFLDLFKVDGALTRVIIHQDTNDQENASWFNTSEFSRATSNFLVARTGTIPCGYGRDVGKSHLEAAKVCITNQQG